MYNHFPINEIIPEIKKILSEHNSLVIQAPPGAGKSTILPIELLNEEFLDGKKILMLEPRRLAARSVATRMASLLQEEVGEKVGYRVRFDNKTGKNTRLEVLTEGILTRMLQEDNLLEGVGMVIFDEFHERSLHADLALALCKEVQQVLRPDLRIVVMSATLESKLVSDFLNDAPVVTSLGKQYPVEIKYLGNDPTLPVPVKVSKAIKKALQETEGDILVFLPGTGEIKKTEQILQEENTQAEVHLLYGDLSNQKQQDAILPDKYGRRKIILSTAIAETSLTIEGVKVVVDSGLSRVPTFDPSSGLSKLDTIPVTKDSADQRSGRAGRVSPGVCYRLWPEGTHQYLLDSRKPEILEADLASTVLEMLNWGVKDINQLQWITSPPNGAVNQAIDLLKSLEAVSEGKITSRGKKMLRLPAHPRIAHMLLLAGEWGLLLLACDIAALLEERDFMSRQTADISERIAILSNWRKNKPVKVDRSSLERIERSIKSWKRIFRVKEEPFDFRPEEVGKLVSAAYPDRIAKKRDSNSFSYRLSSGRIASLSDHDPLAVSDWLAIAQMDAGTHEGKIYLAAPLNSEDIMYMSRVEDAVFWDNKKGMLIARKETRIGDLVVESENLKNIDGELKLKVLCDVVRKEGIALFDWNEKVENIQARVCSLKSWRPDDGWPDLFSETLLQSPEEWLLPYLGSVNKKEDFKKLDLAVILNAMIPYELSIKLNAFAPENINVPSGSMIKIKYHIDGSLPVLAVRLQEMFGLLETPAINEGRTKLLLHLLSPGYKPVQVTQDLKSFWQNTYPAVRKELRVRYQKHHWPEDPWTAEAVRGVVRRKPK